MNTRHRQRHGELHRALDELFADFITHSCRDDGFTEAPIIELIDWSFTQSQWPDHDDPAFGDEDDE